MKRLMQVIVVGAVFMLGLSSALTQLQSIRPQKTHDSTKPDLVVDPAKSVMSKTTSALPSITQPAKLASPKILSDKDKLQLFAAANLNLQQKSGVVTKAVLTARQPALRGQACFWATGASTYYPGQIEDGQGTPFINIKGEMGSDVQLTFVPYQAGQPTLVTFYIKAGASTSIRMVGGGLDQHIMGISGDQTLSCIVTPGDTNPVNILLMTLDKSTDWYFYSAEITVLK